MSNYSDKLADLLFQYEVLTSEFKEIYPVYKLDSTNPEIQSMYENIQFQIQNIFSQMETLKTELTNKNNSEQSTMNKLNVNLENSKEFYNENQPRLQEIIDSNQGAIPREQEVDLSLHNKYFDLIYIIFLLGVTGYSLRKLLY